MFRGLQNRRITGCQGTDEWTQGELEGVIPGTDHEDAAQGFWNHLGLPRAEGNGNRHPFGTHPTTQMSTCEFQLLPQGDNLKESFGCWFSEIVLKGFQHVLLMLFDQCHQPSQLLFAPGQGSSHPRANALLHPGQLLDGEDHGADVLARRV